MSPFKRRIQDARSAPTSYIAPAAKIVGKLAGQGPYVFCGTMEGECDIDGPLTIAAGSRWCGTLRATDVVIAGVIEGDVIASKRVEVASTARITGSITGHSIAIAEGAIIEGEIKVKTGEAPLKFLEKRAAP